MQTMWALRQSPENQLLSTPVDHTIYQNPLITRYASSSMSRLWSEQSRIEKWRFLWLALAESQRELGLDVIQEGQLAELREHQQDIDFETAARYEKELRHDVMAHVHTYGDACPTARAIIHLGATSCYVTDNGDLLLIRDALDQVAVRLASVLDKLGNFAVEHRDLACLAFTHMQPAQPTTIGKRASLWAYDLAMDLERLEFEASRLRARGVKGTTGTQASFLALFNGEHEKVRQLDRLVAEKMGFELTYAVTGQTYSRKVDAMILDVLSGIAQSAHKLATDVRLLANRKELEEPFEKKQIGSSAMAYKRNPMRSERVCSLARFVISLQSSPAQTFATQWMERTLDDSANRRLVIPQAFLAIDAILILLENICDGMVVYPQVVARNLGAELPFMATENILMAAGKLGGDRQELHEVIRQHSQAAAAEVKQHGRDNDLIQRLQAEPLFSQLDLDTLLDPNSFVGRAPLQVDEFIQEVIAPIRQRYQTSQASAEELRV